MHLKIYYTKWPLAKASLKKLLLVREASLLKWQTLSLRGLLICIKW